MLYFQILDIEPSNCILFISYWTLWGSPAGGVNVILSNIGYWTFQLHTVHILLNPLRFTCRRCKCYTFKYWILNLPTAYCSYLIEPFEVHLQCRRCKCYTFKYCLLNLSGWISYWTLWGSLYELLLLLRNISYWISKVLTIFGCQWSLRRCKYKQVMTHHVWFPQIPHRPATLLEKLWRISLYLTEDAIAKLYVT